MLLHTANPLTPKMKTVEEGSGKSWDKHKYRGIPVFGKATLWSLILAEHAFETAYHISLCGGASSGGNLTDVSKETTFVVVYREH
jgi:hypothetical protein